MRARTRRLIAPLVLAALLAIAAQGAVGPAGDVVVTWRVAFRGWQVTYFVIGTRQPGTRLPLPFAYVRGRRRGAFRVRLHDARHVRFATVIAQSEAGGPQRKVTVAVA